MPHDEDDDVDEVGDKGDLASKFVLDSSLYLQILKTRCH